jgi:hypothetical protein
VFIINVVLEECMSGLKNENEGSKGFLRLLAFDQHVLSFLSRIQEPEHRKQHRELQLPELDGLQDRTAESDQRLEHKGTGVQIAPAQVGQNPSCY